MSTRESTTPAAAQMTCLYGWLAGLALGAIGTAWLAGGGPAVVAGIGSGAAAAFLVLGSWHWALRRRRPWTAWLVFFPVKYGLLVGCLYGAFHWAGAHPAGIVGGIALLAAAAVPFAFATRGCGGAP